MQERRNKPQEKGFSLIELLIALTIFAVITGGLFNTLNKGQQRFIFEQDVLEAQQSGRNAVDMMEREIRLAGLPKASYFDSTATVAANMTAVGITTAAAADLIFEADINEDGIVETVEYALSGTTLQRSAVPKGNAASLQTLAQNVSSLTFSYYDTAGNTLTAPVGTPASVARVQIAVGLTTIRPDPESRKLRSVSIQSSAQVRNS